VFKFYELIRDYGDNIMAIMSTSVNRPYGLDQGVTLFAPSNEALDQISVKQILQDKKRIKQILELHFVKEKLSLDMIKNKSVGQVSSSFSLSTMIKSTSGNTNVRFISGLSTMCEPFHLITQFRFDLLTDKTNNKRRCKNNISSLEKNPSSAYSLNEDATRNTNYTGGGISSH